MTYQWQHQTHEVTYADIAFRQQPTDDRTARWLNEQSAKHQHDALRSRLARARRRGSSSVLVPVEALSELLAGSNLKTNKNERENGESE